MGTRITVEIHVDEIYLKNRPHIEPSLSDREVWVDPLPDPEVEHDWLQAFGPVEDVFRVPGPPGQQTHRGYVRFSDHSGALQCVETGAGTWSESERILSSKKRGSDQNPAYPTSVVALILGHKGEYINQLKDKLGASFLALRGEGLGHGQSSTSSRLHFVCKADPDVIGNVAGGLEDLMATVHLNLEAKMQDKEALAAANSNLRSPRRSGGMVTGRMGSNIVGGGHELLPPPPAAYQGMFASGCGACGSNYGGRAGVNVVGGGTPGRLLGYSGCAPRQASMQVMQRSGNFGMGPCRSGLNPAGMGSSRGASSYGSMPGIIHGGIPQGIQRGGMLPPAPSTRVSGRGFQEASRHSSGNSIVGSSLLVPSGKRRKMFG